MPSLVFKRPASDGRLGNAVTSCSCKNSALLDSALPQSALPHSALSPYARLTDAGFTLIEMLVAIAILAIMLGVAVLALPNHDERYWRDNLDQLVVSLNLAQEESAMSGMPMMAQVDSSGWRFLIPNASAAVTGNSNVAASSSALLPDVYRSQTWYKPVEIATLQLTLGGEQVVEPLQIPIKQESRFALLVRARNGRFSWIKP